MKSAFLKRARALGFDVIRITSANSVPGAAEGLRHWLSAGHHGSMEWMAETEARRGSPRGLWPEVNSVIMVGVNYGSGEDPLEHLAHRDRGSIALYARRRDYHDVIKGKLKEAAGFLAVRSGCDVKVFVDTAPVMERPLAEAAGLGWQGKHTVLVSREFGSWLFLGAIYTTCIMPVDEPEPDHCGSCRRCLDICPTNAFPAPHTVDSRRCISYLTIESKGHIPREFRQPIGNRIFGCDDCLAVCPWNKFAKAGHEVRLAHRADLSGPPLSELLELDDAGFKARFNGTPIRRLGRDRFLRNVLIAAGNSAEPAFLPRIRTLLGDPSPLVRAMAVWALSNLETPAGFNRLAAGSSPLETDPDVRAEWLQDAADAPSSGPK